MKTKFFLLASLLFTAFNSNAALINESPIQEEYRVLPSEYNECSDPDCLFFLQSCVVNKVICLDKKSDVVVCNDKGVTLFAGEQVKMLDCQNWQPGNYIVKVNGQEKLKFTI